MLALGHLDRQASRERSSRQGRQVRQARQADQARQGGQARQAAEARQVSQVRQVGQVRQARHQAVEGNRSFLARAVRSRAKRGSAQLIKRWFASLPGGQVRQAMAKVNYRIQVCSEDV